MRQQDRKNLTTLSNKRGSLLLMAYFVIIVLLGIGATFMQLITSEARIAERQRLSTIAFHVAEAGIERGLYDLRQDFISGGGSPSWSDGTINTYNIGPNTVSFYAIPYASTSFNGGSYAVQLKNVAGSIDDVWVRSTGTISGVSHTIDVYVKMVNLSPWNTAIFAGSGASGSMVNGNVNIRGSVVILGSNLTSGDYAVDLGGTAEIVGNNYNGVPAALVAKVPALPTVTYEGETVQTLNATLRVKRGKVGVSGSASVGEADVKGNSVKEKVDGIYVTDGFGGNKGTASVYSDNGVTSAYDLGDTVAFPSLSTPFGGYSTYKDYLKANALVLTTELSGVTPQSSFSYSSAKGSITLDGAGNMTVSGIVYIDGNNNLNLSTGSTTTVNYTGKGTIYVSGSANINVNLLTPGNSSYPTNIVGIMTPNTIEFNEANTDVMGVFYAENKITVKKQTDIMGTIVSNFFDVGTNVPSIFQVPATANNMPPGMIGTSSTWYMVVAWMKP